MQVSQFAEGDVNPRFRYGFSPETMTGRSTPSEVWGMNRLDYWYKWDIGLYLLNSFTSRRGR